MDKKIDVIEGGVQWQKDRRLDQLDFNLQDAIYYILEEINEMRGFESTYAKVLAKELLNVIEDKAQLLNVEYPSEWDIVDANNDICVFAEGNVQKLGYNVQKCREETLREISSRQGAWSDEKGKWIKDPNQDPKTLYSSDYSKFKKGN